MQSETTGGFGSGGEERGPEGPGEMAEDARSYVRETAARSASEMWESVLHTVREHPVPVAFVGGGLAALLAVRAGSTGHARYLGHGRRSRGLLGRGRSSGMSAWLEGASGRAGEAGSQLVERGAHAAARARELAQPLLDADARARAQQQAQQLREGVESLLHEQPLLLGVAGFAMGFFLGGRSSRIAQPGASLPQSP